MNKIKIATLICVLVLAWGSHAALAADQGSKEEAVALAKKAAAYLQANGREKTLAEINNPKGQFVNPNLHVFIGDMRGLCLAHTTQPELAGKDMMEYKDPEGYCVTKERLKSLQKNSSAWQTYKYVDPATKKTKTKSTYLERVGDLYVGVGIYQ
jgi:signal transduction histidine kinase